MANYKLLVVDDELFVRELLEEYFSKMDFDVVVAGSGPDALKAVAENSFNVALIDLKMSDMDGIETLKKIQQLDGNLILILMTGYPTVESSVEAMRSGAFDYVVKPFRLNELKDIVLRAVKEHHVKCEIAEIKTKVAAIERKLSTIVGGSQSESNMNDEDTESLPIPVNSFDIEAEDQLDRWGKLLRDGFISRQEFEERKKRILSEVC